MNKKFEIFRLEDRVLFEAAGAAEFIEAVEVVQDNPNANVSEGERLASEERNSLKNAPTGNPADLLISNTFDPAEIANLDAQIDAIVNGPLPNGFEFVVDNASSLEDAVVWYNSKTEAGEYLIRFDLDNANITVDSYLQLENSRDGISLTIDGDMNGDGQGDVVLSGNGTNGGIFEMVNSTNITITNLTIRDAGDASAGAIRADDNASLTVENCVFVDNNATAINWMSNGSLTIYNSQFLDNESMNDGGALIISGVGEKIIENCYFEGNTAVMGGGGAIYLESGSLKISNSTFYLNEAEGEGGGAIQAEFQADGFLTIDNSTFYQNISGTLGGAVRIFYNGNDASVLITNSTFTENFAVGDEGGDAIYNGVGDLKIVNTLLVGNGSSGEADLYQALGGETSLDYVFYTKLFSEDGGNIVIGEGCKGDVDSNIFAGWNATDKVVMIDPYSEAAYSGILYGVNTDQLGNSRTLADDYFGVKNYTIGAVTAKLVIDLKQNNGSQQYNGSEITISPDLSWKYFQQGEYEERPDNIDITAVLTSDPTPVKDVGEYIITPSEGKIFSATGEDISHLFVIANYATGIFTVTSGDVIVVEVSDIGITYGDRNFSLTQEYEHGDLTITVTLEIDGVTPQPNGLYAAGTHADVLKIVSVVAMQGGKDVTKNYTWNTSATGSLNVARKSITVTADANQSKIYGANDPELKYTVGENGLEDGDTLDGEIEREAGENVGTYAITQGTLGNSNYSITFIGADFEITAKAITVTVDTGQNKVYGDDDPELTYKADGLLDGDKFDGKLARETGENVGTYAITQGTLGNSNYSITFVGADFGITAKSITVTADTGQDKVYGSADSKLTYKTDGLINGDTLEGELAREAGENVGIYAITLGTLHNANYSITFIGADFEITAKAITVTADADQTKVYGSSEPELTYNVDGLINGDVLEGKLAREAGENVGTYAITQGSLKNANYSITFIGADFEITAKTITVTANEQTKVYGSADPELTYQVEGLVGTDTLDGKLARADGENVGIYLITQGTLTAGKNYSITFIEADFKITAKTITVTANEQTKVYGSADPELTYRVEGLVGTDTLDGKLARGDGENVGTYAITQGTLNNANYQIEFTGSLLTITAKTIIVTANEQTKVYGSADPELTYRVEGLVGTDTLDGKLARADGENVGTYAIIQGTLNNANYQIEFTGSLLTITAKTITVTADAQTKVYGSADPELTYQVEGIIGDDTLEGKLVRESGENVGTYMINQGTLKASANYLLTFVGADFKITAKTITVTANEQTKVYGDADPELIYHVEGLVGTDMLDGKLAREGGENVGIYAINLGTLKASANYLLTFVGADFKITAKAITVTADAQTKVYGSADPDLTYQVEGLIGDDELEGALEREAGKNVGIYAITQGTLKNANYSIEFIGAEFEITKLTLAHNVTVVDSKTYDGTVNANYTGGLINVVEGDDITLDARLIYSDKNVGTGKAISAGTWEISGEDAKNYDLSAFVNQKADITRLVLTHNVTVADSKTYDGSVDAVVSGGLTNVVQGDDVLLSALFVYNSADVLFADTISNSSWGISGVDAGNYELGEVPFESKDGFIVAREVNASWYSSEPYIFNGEDQGATISANYVDINGNRIELDVEFSGQGTVFREAGRYTASVKSADANYTITASSARRGFIMYSDSGDFNVDNYSEGLNPNYSAVIPALQGALSANSSVSAVNYNTMSYPELISHELKSQEIRYHGQDAPLFQSHPGATIRSGASASILNYGHMTIDNLSPASSQMVVGGEIIHVKGLIGGQELFPGQVYRNGLSHIVGEDLDNLEIKGGEADLPEQLLDQEYDLSGLNVDLPEKLDMFKSKFELLLEEMVRV